MFQNTAEIILQAPTHAVEIKTEDAQDVPPPSKRTLLDSLLFDENDDVSVVCSYQLTVEQRALSELQRYQALPVKNDNPLTFWKEHQASFPTLAKMARKYLCAQATLVASECSAQLAT